ncbi:MAG: hypothetical protein WKG01_18580 [Kofleriaceae bacterium]
MVRNSWLGVLALMSVTACVATDDEQPEVSETAQANYGTIDGQCIGRCSRINVNGYDDAECVADPCWENGECELDSCEEVGLYAANRNKKIQTYRCQLGSVWYDNGSGGTVANCDPDNDGKINMDKLDVCCTKIELRPEVHGIGKAFDVNTHSGPDSFMVPDSLPPTAPYTLNDFCPRTEINQTETTPIHGDATRVSNADACGGKPTVQWMRTEVEWPKEPSYAGLWSNAMKCGSDVLSWGVAIFELYTRKSGESLFPKIASVLTDGSSALGSCVELAGAIPPGDTSTKYVTWEAVNDQGTRGQFDNPMFYTTPDWPHYGTNTTGYWVAGTHSQTLKACRRNIEGRYMANRRVRQWSFWQGEWVRSDSQYAVGFKYFEIPGATFKIEASEPCTCRPDADSFGIDCTGKKTTHAGHGSYIITADGDGRSCVKHCFKESNCMTYDCTQPAPACPLSDYFEEGSGSGSGSGGYPRGRGPSGRLGVAAPGQGPGATSLARAVNPSRRRTPRERSCRP